jgi:thiamine biosynthesis lipoprotein
MILLWYKFCLIDQRSNFTKKYDKIIYFISYMNRLLKILFLLSVVALESPAQTSKPLQRFEYAHKSMGTLFRIICYAEDMAQSDRLSLEAFKRIDDLNNIMSDYLPESELNNLSRRSGNGEYIEVSTDLYEIIRLSYEWSERTNGIFDITVGPYTQLWRRAGRKDLLPTPEQIKKASESVGFKFIHLGENRQSVLLMKAGMQLDLGGIAKGFAVDEVYNLFTGAGLAHVLIDGGGDIRAGDPPPGREGWKIVLENLEEDRQVVQLANAAIATSGDLYRYILIDSVKYSHIIDPRTGYGLTIQKTVTVQAGSCTEADVLASALSIWEPKEGLLFLSSIPSTKAVILQESNGKLERFEHGKLEYVTE